MLVGDEITSRIEKASNALYFGMLFLKEICEKAQYVKKIKASDLLEATRAPIGGSVFGCLSLALNPRSTQPLEHLERETGVLSKVSSTHKHVVKGLLERAH